MEEELNSISEQNARLRSELAAAREFIEAIIEHAPDWVTIIDAGDLRVRMISKCGRELLGHGNERVQAITYEQYTRIFELCRPDGTAPENIEELPLCRATLKGEIVTNEEWMLKLPDGNQTNLLCNAGPIRDSSGNIIAGIIVCRNITERKRIEEQTRIKHLAARKDLAEELRVKSNRLEEVNAALKTLLRQRDEDRKEFEEALLVNIENLILPYIKRLKSGQLSGSQASLLEILEAHLKELTSKFGKTLALEYRILTPTEMRVAALVRDGKTSKEIADLLCISEKTASFHRNNIRIKLGLRGIGVNLRSHLLSLA